MQEYEKAVELCTKYHQEKVLKVLEKDKKDSLIKQIVSIDFEQIEEIKKEIGKETTFSKDTINPIACVDEKQLTEEEKQNYRSIGETIISSRKYAVVTMAGGQRNKAWA